MSPDHMGPYFTRHGVGVFVCGFPLIRRRGVAAHEKAWSFVSECQAFWWESRQSGRYQSPDMSTIRFRRADGRRRRGKREKLTKKVEKNTFFFFKHKACSPTRLLQLETKHKVFSGTEVSLMSV